MLRRAWLIVVSVISLLTLPQYAMAAEINSTNYTIYSGDINNDGMKDFVFSAKRSFIILHGDIATPIQFAKDIDLVIYRDGTGYSSPVAFALTQSDIAARVAAGTLKLAQENTDYFVWKTSISIQSNLLLRGSDANAPALMLKSYANILFPVITQIYSPARFPGISSPTVKLTITDYNADGLKDILLEDQTAAAWKTAYIANSSAIPIAFKAIAVSTLDPVITPVTKPVEAIKSVGSTPYTAGVNHKGEATISIPIQIPQGINGMQPQISLNFNSGGVSYRPYYQTSSGSLGFGWGLSGISSINRCTAGQMDIYVSRDPSSEPLDKSVSIRPRLKYDNTDSLCLNSELLVLVSGSNLQPDAQYRTLTESFKLVIVKGTAAEPWFEVRNPNGSIATYGSKPNSHVRKVTTQAGGSLTPYFEWAIDKEVDAFGNQITYNYKTKNESFSYQPNKTRILPSSIQYSGGTLAFNYTAVTPPAISGVLGFKDDGAAAGIDRYRWSYDTSDQLESIKVWVGSAGDAKAYLIGGSGQLDAEIGKSGVRPGWLQECVYTGATVLATCLPSLTFKWEVKEDTNVLTDIVNYTRTETTFTYAFLNENDILGSGSYIPVRGRTGVNQLRNSRFAEMPYDITEPLKSLFNAGTSFTIKWPYWDIDKAMCNCLSTNVPAPTRPTSTIVSVPRELVVTVLERGTGLEPISETAFIPIETRVAPNINSSLVLTDRNILSYSYHPVASSRSRLGFGSLGFNSMRITNHTTGVVTYNQYYFGNDWDGARHPVSRLAATYQYDGFYNPTTGDANLISKSETRRSSVAIPQANGATTYLPIVNQLINSSYEKGVLLNTTIKNNEYTLSGSFIAKIISTVTSGSVIDPTSVTLQNMWGSWNISKPLKLVDSSIKSTDVTTTFFSNSTLATSWLVGFTSGKEKISYNGAKDVNATDSKTQKAEYSAKSGTMAIAMATLFGSDPENKLINIYTYDAQGRQIKVSTSGANVESRSITTDTFATATSLYPGRVVNAMGHVVTNSNFDERFAQPKTMVDPNGLITTQEFDSFGRVSLAKDIDGVSITQAYKYCTPCATVDGKLGAITPIYYKETLSPIRPITREYYDSLNRVIRTDTQAFLANEWYRTDVQYDAVGRVYKTSLRHKVGSTPQFITNTYDNRSRIVKVEQPNGGNITTSYAVEGTGGQQQLKVSSTETIYKADGTAISAEAQIKVSYLNTLGQLTKTVDAVATTSYEYDALGNVIKTIVNGGVDGTTTSTAVFDNAGNRTSITDPNAGTVQSRYTALGQLRWMQDNKGNVTTFTYDKLGRTLTRSSVDGTSNWVYDPLGAKGSLSYTTNNNGYKQTYFYEDNYRAARLSRTETVISVPEIGLSDKTYTDYIDYDVYGRVKKTTSPSGFSSTQKYSGLGYPSAIVRADNAGLLQQNLQMGVFGVERESFADGSITQRIYDPKSGLVSSIKTDSAIKVQDLSYQWRSNGSLETRSNNKSGTPVTDSFSYDSLDRLTSTLTAVNGSPQRTLSQAYNNLGNIKSNISTQPTDAQVTAYQYGTTTNAGPHAISAATIKGIAYSLGYDRNGAIESYTTAGAGQNKFIAYNAANQPSKITVGTSLNDTNPIARDEFRYTPDGARYYKKSTYKEGSRLRAEYTFYIGSYETTYYDTFSTLKQTEKTQVGSSILSVRKTPYSGLIVEKLEVLHRDHLGSVDAITEGSTKIADLAFEPFGARRSSSLLTNISTTEMTNLLVKSDVLSSQGFTGHESLDRTGLIHMNGRVYDPQLGRFLSPDPIVQSPTNSQSWNRYSYVFNNPMKYTDPTGFSCQVLTGTMTSNTNPQINKSTYSISNDCGSSDFLDKSNRSNGDDRAGPPDADKSDVPMQQQIGPQNFHNMEKGGNSIAAAMREAAAALGDYFDSSIASIQSATLSDSLDKIFAPTPGTIAVAGTVKFGMVLAGKANEVAKPTITYTRSALQHTFKHASDFGITRNANNKTLAQLSNVIQSHITLPTTRVIQGTYRGNAVTHFVNPSTGLNVMTNSSGNLLSGWVLNSAQLENVMFRGSL